MLHPPDAWLGYAAGVATSVLWTATSLCFTEAARRIGTLAVNSLRTLLAAVFLLAAHRVLFGSWLPGANTRQILILVLSGWVGLALGDQALFVALTRLGPRLAMLLMTTAPLFAALFGYVQLGEALSPRAWLGVGLTLAGVAWVIAERPRGGPVRPNGFAFGVACGITAAACQACGFMLSKVGIGHGWLAAEERLEPLGAALVRMIAAAAVLAPIAVTAAAARRRRDLARESREASAADRSCEALASGHERVSGPAPGSAPAPSDGGDSPADARSLTLRGSERSLTLRGSAGRVRAAGVLFTICGSVVGPFLGVWMSLEAANRAPLGVAQTLASLPPILVLPVSRLVYGEHISRRAVAGAVAAVTGVAWLFLAAGV